MTAKQKTQVLLCSFLTFLFCCFIPKYIFADTVDCIPYVGNAEPTCRTGEAPLGAPITLYSCVNKDTGPDCVTVNYPLNNLLCGGKVGSGNNPYYCEHPSFLKGYNTKASCEVHCVVSRELIYGTCSKHWEDGHLYCRGGGDCSCSDFRWACHCGYYKDIPPAEGGPNTYGAGTCCGIGNPPCTPQCPNPPCTVTDAMCATANNGNTQYKAVPTGGSLCKGNNASCTDDNGCGGLNTCNTSSCYRPETNISPIPIPNSISLVLDRRDDPNNPGQKVWVSSGALSADPNKPTRVKLPVVSATSTRVPKVSIEGAREVRYLIGGVRGVEDPDLTTHAYRNNYPASLTEGAEGSVSAKYSTLNECDDYTKEGDDRIGYYKVNTLPTIVDLSISGDKNTLSGCEASERYTGKEANNPLTVEVIGRDADGVSDINGLSLWLVQEGTSIDGYFDKSYWMGGGKTTSDIKKIGIFISKRNNGIYKANPYSGNSLGWGRDNGDSAVYVDVNGERKVAIEKIEVVEHGRYTDARTPIGEQWYRFVVKLYFPTDQSYEQFYLARLLGKYNFYASMTDIFSHGAPSNRNYTYMDLKNIRTESSWYWNFDFISPRITDYTAQFDKLDQRVIKVNWISSDYGSSVKDTVVNVEKGGIGDKDNYQVMRVLPSLSEGNTITLQKLTEDNIGKINPLVSGWHYQHSTQPPLSATSINIMNNGESRLKFLVTVYDKACNRYKVGDPVDPNPDDPDPLDPPDPPEFDLNKWIATKGGIFYSKDRVTYAPKLLDPNIENYNTGSELITTGSNQPVGALDFGEILNPTIVNQVKDTNETRKRMLFNLLLGKIKAIGDGKRIITSLGECGHNEICYMGSIDPDGNIGSDIVTIGDKNDNITQTYQGTILVVTEGDIDVYPDVVARDSGLDSLVLFAGGDINVKGSNRSSAGSLVYDQLDMLMIARNRIYIPKDAQTDDLQQDGLKVFGSVIGLGVDNSNPAVLMERNLGFLNPTHPVLIVNYHPKYTSISEIFFGTDTSTYKQEVGFKL